MGSPETDCWYLYTLIRDKPMQDPPEPDQTLEILMTQLDPDVMSIFTRNVCSSADEATEKSGIDKLIPNMIIDDFLFEPCGYSMNGVSKNVSSKFLFLNFRTKNYGRTFLIVIKDDSREIK